jgi:hypothetical protein
VSAGYSFTGRPSDSFIHIAAYAHWVNLGFNHGVDLDDPDGVLQGSGRQVRHMRISELADVRKPVVRAFVRAAIAHAIRPDGKAPRPEPVSCEPSIRSGAGRRNERTLMGGSVAIHRLRL